MGNRRAIHILDTLIEVIENKDGRWSKVVRDPFKETMLERLKLVKDNIGTDYVDMYDLEEQIQAGEG